MITHQLDAKELVKVDFKMSTLKPKMYSWLYFAWLHISSKKEMVIKGWEECRLLRLFDQSFQRKAMMDNVKTPLFKHVVDNQVVDSNFNGREEETNAEITLEEVIMKSLTKVEELSLGSITTSMASLHDMARKESNLQQQP